MNHISYKNKGKGVTVEGEDKLEQRGEEGKDKQSSFSAERRLNLTREVNKSSSKEAHF